VCIYWLNPNLVLQHATLLNALKTRFFIDATLYGAKTPMKIALLQNALIPCALSEDSCPEEYAVKPSNAKQWKKNQNLKILRAIQ
jgi:hypothetical protein